MLGNGNSCTVHLVVILGVLVALCICCTHCVFVVRTVYLWYGVWVVLDTGCIVYLLYCALCTCCTVCIDVFSLDAALLARSQYSEGPATGHLDTGFT